MSYRTAPSARPRKRRTLFVLLIVLAVILMGSLVFGHSINAHLRGMSVLLRFSNPPAPGLSFAGGMALLAAARPEYSSKISFVAAIGAHDDLARVSRFFAINKIEKPDGSIVPFSAHEYGVLVLAYSHLEDFFSPADIPAARESLRLWLWEQLDASQSAARKMSAAGQTEFGLLVHHRERLEQQLLLEIERH